jgi:hypothetical protein
VGSKIMKDIKKNKKTYKIAYRATKIICKKLAKYLWTHHKLFLTVILTSLILIILGYRTEGGFLIGMYLIVVLFGSPYESEDDFTDDLIILRMI